MPSTQKYITFTCETLKMLKRYAMTTEDSSKKNNPRSQVVPNKQVNTAHAFIQYLKRKTKWRKCKQNNNNNNHNNNKIFLLLWCFRRQAHYF